jgi:hypothetical protein
MSAMTRGIFPAAFAILIFSGCAAAPEGAATDAELARLARASEGVIKGSDHSAPKISAFRQTLVTDHPAALNASRSTQHEIEQKVVDSANAEVTQEAENSLNLQKAAQHALCFALEKQYETGQPPTSTDWENKVAEEALLHVIPDEARKHLIGKRRRFADRAQKIYRDYRNNNLQSAALGAYVATNCLGTGDR